MCPRIDIFSIESNLNSNQVIQAINKTNHSRIPVYKENLDNIIGVLHIKDLLPFLEKKEFEWETHENLILSKNISLTSKKDNSYKWSLNLNTDY